MPQTGLATKITVINEIADLCEKVRAEVPPAARPFTVSQGCAGHPVRVHAIDFPPISRMSTSNETQFEVLPTTTGDSWRVRIIEQKRTQYINGFEFRERRQNIGL